MTSPAQSAVGSTADGVHWVYCAACDTFETYRTAALARDKLDTHANYHAGFACPAAAG